MREQVELADKLPCLLESLFSNLPGTRLRGCVLVISLLCGAPASLRVYRFVFSSRLLYLFLFPFPEQVSALRLHTVHQDKTLGPGSVSLVSISNSQVGFYLLSLNFSLLQNISSGFVLLVCSL